jgi:hypothetical protein
VLAENLDDHFGGIAGDDQFGDIQMGLVRDNVLCAGYVAAPIRSMATKPPCERVLRRAKMVARASKDIQPPHQDLPTVQPQRACAVVAARHRVD